MKSIKLKLIAITLIAVLAVGVLAGCSSNGENTDVKGTVELGVVNWADAIAMTSLAEVILEEKMGYEVETTMADVAPIFTSIVSGNTDAYLDVWMPLTHASYMEKYGDDLEVLSTSYEGAKIGLVVPAYVEIDSIDELNENKELFEGKIVGIDAGAGIMAATENVMKEYDLDYELLTGSGPTMTAALDKAISAKEPIIVTGWSPHWKFSRYDLKYLEDPKGTMGEAEKIQIITRKGFAEDMPEVNEFLSKIQFTNDELSSLMGVIEDGNDPIESARQWMNDNEEVVNNWLPSEQ